MRGRDGARRGLGCIVAALFAAGMSASLVVGAPLASAELVGYDMSSDARGMQVFTIIPDQQVQPEFNVPQASSAMTSGQGYGLATVAWPGATIANGGSLLGLLVPGFPPEVAALLLYPVRAEARTGQDPPTTVYDVPGLSMRARADTNVVEAEAGVQGLAVIPGTFGTSRATTSNRAFDDSIRATARSVVENLDIAGVLKIDQIVSTATATSDGEKAVGSASTVVTGVTVNGNAATIDASGLHLGPASQPIDAITNQLNQQALSQAGINVAVGPATNEISGASAIVAASSVVITWTQQGTTFGLALGGARANAVAGANSEFLEDTATGGDDLLTGDTDVLGGADFGDVGIDDGGLVDGGLSAPSLDDGTGVAAPGNDGIELTPTALASANGRPLSKTAMFFAVVAAGLLAVGMRRLSTDVLTDPTGSMPCLLPGEGS